MRNLVLLVIVVLIILGSVMCSTLHHTTAAASGEPTFSGSASCRSCHTSIFDSSHLTAHYFTSRPASQQFIKGSFEEGRNEFKYNQWMSVLLVKRDTSF